MRDLGIIENDQHNLSVSIARLEHEYTVLKFGRYLDDYDLARLRVVIKRIQEKLDLLNAEAEMLRG